MLKPRRAALAPLPRWQHDWPPYQLLTAPPFFPTSRFLLAVEYVRVLPEERVALVKYATPEAAAMAVGSLNGIEVLGEVLHVHHSPRLTPRATALGAP